MSTNTLSDKTRIGDTNWADLKESAMQSDYQKFMWFVRLADKDKKLLKELIEAQKAQGNMNGLQEGTFKTIHEVRKIPVTSQKLKCMCIAEGMLFIGQYDGKIQMFDARSLEEIA